MNKCNDITRCNDSHPSINTTHHLPLNTANNNDLLTICRCLWIGSDNAHRVTGRDQSNDTESANHQPRSRYDVAEDHEQEQRHRDDQAKHCRFFPSQLGECLQIPSQLVLDRLGVLQRETTGTEHRVRPDEKAGQK